MATLHIANVRHYVEHQGALSVGDRLRFGFHPSPGEGVVSITFHALPPLPGGVAGPGARFTPGGLPETDDISLARATRANMRRGIRGVRQAATVEADIEKPTSSAGEEKPSVIFLKRPPFPRVIHPRFATNPGLIVEEPELPPVPPDLPRLPFRVEVGPENGPFQVFDRPRPGTIRFIVQSPGGTPSTLADDDGMLVNDNVILDDPSRTPKRPPRWICRIENEGDSRVACLARVLFDVRRTVRVTEIPRDALTRVFEGALRWLTPTITVANGIGVVALPDSAAEVLGTEPTEFDLNDFNLSGFHVDRATVSFAPAEFEVMSAAQMMRFAYRDIEKRIGELATAEATRDGEGVHERFRRLMPDDFVERMVSFSFGGERQLASLAAFHLTAGNPSSGDYSAVGHLFDDLGIPRRLTAFADDPVLLATVTVAEVKAGGSAIVGTYDIFVDTIATRIYTLISTRNRFDPHPLSQMPGHPRHDEYLEEWTTSTDTSLMTRVFTTIEDFDVDGSGITGEAGEFLGDLFGKIPSKGEIAQQIDDAIRGFLAQFKGQLDTGMLDVILTIAERDHVLHDVRFDPDAFVIEHFDPIADPKFRLPQPSRKLTRPIDGPMPSDASARLARIDHIVVVTMENRSFDHMLGFLSHPDRDVQPSGPRGDVDGLTGAERLPPGGNVSGDPITPQPSTEDEFRPDPRHGFYAVQEQIGPNGDMDGFMASFRDLLKDSEDIRVGGSLDEDSRIVSFQPAGAVPTYAYAAHEFAVLDRYFCSFPGGTQPNRVCMLSGATPALTNSEITADLGYLEKQTLFGLLDRAKVSWRYYEGDIGFIRAFKPFRNDFTRVRPLSEFLRGGRDALSSVTFIDPNFKEAPSAEPPADDHAPTPLCRGQVLLFDIIERLRDSRSWDSTLLIITYDEHGGFWDHVPPPGTTAFAAANPNVAAIPRVHSEASTFGVRVPAILVSPYLAAGRVGHRIYDHTSITRTILQRFVPDLVGLMPDRVRRARHFGELLESERRTSIPRQQPLDEDFGCDVTSVRFSNRSSAVRFDLGSPEPDDERFQMQLLGVPLS